MAQLVDLAQTQTKRDQGLRLLAYIFQLRIEPLHSDASSSRHGFDQPCWISLRSRMSELPPFSFRFPELSQPI